ncbi:MAG: DUF2141 domain-containing protein [Gemmatimonadota bacterium]|jgi:uncharacterized protein (DUF2141 family)
MLWTTYARTVVAGLLVFAPFPTASPSAVETAEISIDVTGLESDVGTVRLALFDGPEGFPDAPAIASVVEPSGRSARWEVRVPYGRYAVAAVHDADGDGRLDTNFLGMPTERYGFSNGARGTFGAPSFQDASFPVDRPTVTLTVEVR